MIEKNNTQLSKNKRICNKCFKEYEKNNLEFSCFSICEDCYFREMSSIKNATAVKCETIKHEELNDFVISTIYAHDTKKHETCIISEYYNGSKGVIVEEYETKKQSLKGHIKWKRIVSGKPKHLSCVSTSEFADTKGYIYPRKESER